MGSSLEIKSWEDAFRSVEMLRREYQTGVREIPRPGCLAHKAYNSRYGPSTDEGAFYSITAMVDSLEAAFRLVQVDPILPNSLFALFRVSIEASATADWLMGGSGKGYKDINERGFRYEATQVKEETAALHANAPFVDPTKVVERLKEKKRELLNYSRERAAVGDVRYIVGKDDVATLPGYTSLVEMVDARKRNAKNRPDMLSRITLYRILSGSAHGLKWAADGITGSSSETLASLAGVTVDYAFCTVNEWQTWRGLAHYSPCPRGCTVQHFPIAVA